MSKKKTRRDRRISKLDIRERDYDRRDIFSKRDFKQVRVG